ncbi:acyl-ACP thioesterase [Acidimicrobiales bacterium]|nr:acyl-ACP thioesterase [Acidimicrobiales bacterium]
MSIQTELTVSHTSTVTPDQIDELGHMNVRWYGANAVAATTAMCERLGIGSPALHSTYTRHHHEQMEGNQLEVRSAVLAEGDHLRFFHELRNQANNDLAATFVHEVEHPLLEMPGIELPAYGQARSIDLGIDRLASAPSLDELRSRGLATRLERTVTTEDSMDADIVPTWLTNNLIWGGERPDGETDWIQDTADGDRVAFASMETRLRVHRPVAVGTRIQTFGAIIALGTKISHDLNWVFDLDTDELLAVAETVDLAFSIPNRRSREIPPEVREREEARLHPDLAD